MTDLLGEEPEGVEADTSQQAGVGPLNYDALPGLEEICLEDSFVREIVETPSSLTFVLMAALLEGHPFYTGPPAPNERHCYKPATLSFPDAKVTWLARHETRFKDAKGAVDIGNIDRFEAPPQGGYHLEGDWGALDIVRSRAPVFVVVGASPDPRAALREALAAWVKGVPVPEHTHDHDHGPPAHSHGDDHDDHGHDHPHRHDNGK